MIETEDLIDNACINFKKLRDSNVTKFNTLDKWLDKESQLYQKEIKNINNEKNYKTFKRGQIIKVDFGINPGAELCYTHFAIVITKNDSIKSDSLTVIPITSKKGNNDKRLNIGKVLKNIYPNSLKYTLNCYLNVSQMKSISKSRIFIERKQHICSDDVLNKIDEVIVKEFTNK